MKFFDTEKKENVNKSLREKILSAYEKAGLLPLYIEAFEKLHEKMIELKTAKITEGMSIEEAEKFVNKIEKAAQIEILSQGDQRYLKLADEVSTAFKSFS